MLDFVLSITVLAAIALFFGAFLIWRKTGNRQQAFLMVILALVAIINVAIWTVPDDKGDVPLEQLERDTR